MKSQQEAIIGRKSHLIVRDDEGNLIVDVNDEITSATLDRAEAAGKLEAVIAAAQYENPPGSLPIDPTDEEAYTVVDGVKHFEDHGDNPPGRMPTDPDDEEPYTPTG